VSWFDRTARAFHGSSVADFFPEVARRLDAQQLRALGSDYIQHLRGRAPWAQHITDKMPANFQFAGLIHMALPNARFIHVRRDPVDTCLSCFSKNFSGGIGYSYDLGELGRYYTAYTHLMRHWRRVLPPGVMHELRYEDLVQDFEPQARALVRHCGLEWDEHCLRFHKTERSVRTASVAQVRQPLYPDAVGRWRPFAAMLGPLLAELDEVPDQLADNLSTPEPGAT
jgi:hypothetical protein